MRRATKEILKSEYETNEKEIKKLTEKIENLKVRNIEIEAQLEEITNTEYIKFIKENNISLEELYMLREKIEFKDGN